MLSLLIWIFDPSKKTVPALMLAAGVAMHSTPVGAMAHPQMDVSRDITSVTFPRHRATTDVDDIMDDYTDYLKFVLEIGQDVNPSVARQIEERFNRLKKADENLAARFLKGLRFEMIQKLELSGLSPRNTTSDNPTLRRWVQRYISVWLREVDEYQFRAFAQAIVKR